MWFLLRIAVMSVCLWGLCISAQAQTDGKMLFLNPQTSMVFYSGVNEAGQFQANAHFPIVLAPTNVRRLVALPIGFLAMHGGASDVIVPADGVNPPAVYQSKFINFGTDDTYLSFGPFIFHYHNFGSSSPGEVIDFQADGTSKTYWSAKTFNSWDIVVATKNYLYFYNSISGNSATGKIQPNGAFLTTDARNIGTGPKIIASVDDNILMYNPNGSWVSGQILYTASGLTDAFHQSATQTTNSFLDPGYTDILEVDKHLVFYSRTSGKAAIGHFDPLGVFLLDSKPTFGKGWTAVLRSGRFLTLYGGNLGNVQVGLVSLDGKYTITQKDIVGLGDTFAASSLK